MLKLADRARNPCRMGKQTVSIAIISRKASVDQSALMGSVFSVQIHWVFPVGQRLWPKDRRARVGCLWRKRDARPRKIGGVCHCMATASRATLIRLA